MTTTEMLLLLVLILVLANLLSTFYKRSSLNTEDLKNEIFKTNNDISKIDPLIRAEFSVNREEIQKSAKDSREELSNSIKSFGEQLSKTINDLSASQKSQFETFSAFLQTMTRNNEERFEKLIKSNEEKQNEFKVHLTNTSKEAKEALIDSLKANEIKLDKIRETVEKKLQILQEDNNKKLEEMRATVDEKLQTTLEKRFNDSFTLISERLELVHKGLGEMQNLANSVGDIKKVMTNVKSRGIMGEYQLANILEDLLTNEQYGKNVKTKDGSGANVEFAIKLPNNNSFEKTLWLPIDSKFPKEDYEALVDAYDDGDPTKLEILRKSFKNAIIKNAKDIKEKYIDPPNTTEYGIMFLPFESLYAEVLRTPGLFELLQKDFKIIITGPTTLSALLNSLQMGFRTLAIEKRSSEVWDILGVVKTEFGKFGTVLEKTKKKLQEATNTIETASVRSRAIERQLKNVQELPAGDKQLKIANEINEEVIEIVDNNEDILSNETSQ